MNNETPINVDGSPDLMGKAGQLLHAMRERAGKAVCLLDARMRTLTVEPEEGAATAEYAVVLVAATGFAAVLVGIMKSDAINAADQHHQESAERRVIHAEAMVETPYR